jgi:trehalose/maltose transport system substrate-binding protein
MAPEVWAGSEISACVDVYALGCILYEMLTGEVLFRGDTRSEVTQAQQQELPFPSVWPRTVPEGIEKVLRKAVAHNPKDRYQHVDALLAALQIVEAERQIEEQRRRREERLAQLRADAEEALTEGNWEKAKTALTTLLSMAHDDTVGLSLWEQLASVPDPSNTPDRPRLPQWLANVPIWGWAVSTLAILGLVLGVFVFIPPFSCSPAGLAESSTQSAELTRENPPAVPGARQASRYCGQRLVYESNPIEYELDIVLAERFTRDTGIKVEVTQSSGNATQTYERYRSLFGQGSAAFDVVILDIIWPGAFAQHLVDLGPELGAAAQQHYPGIVQSDTVNGKLVAMPWFGNFGMLYYRADLLEKYGYRAPPATWQELEAMAQAIQAGERAEGNGDFWGFIWQGKDYEGLTCNALEWLASSGGGMIIEDGEVTLKTPQAAAVLNRARAWIGTISPPNVTTYQEEESQRLFQAGNAAFMRNWPYAYAAGNAADSPIKGKFDVAPLPHDPDQPSVGTVGGGQLAVSRYSEHQDAAIEFVRYMTSPEVQRWRAVVGSYVPTIRALSTDPQVTQAMPFLRNMVNVQRISRPSRETGESYPIASEAIFGGIHRILNGDDASTVLPQIDQDLRQIVTFLP